jgi:cysteinyl-tRNA synthetase
LPIGTVVTSLPQGCTTSSVDNVEYYHCGPNYYRTAFQGNTLVYVTTDAPK